MKLLVNIVNTLSCLGHWWTGIARSKVESPYGFFTDYTDSMAAEFATSMPERADPDLAIKALIAYGDAVCTTVWNSMRKDLSVRTGYKPSEYLEVLDGGRGVSFTSAYKRLAVLVTTKHVEIKIQRPGGTVFVVKKEHDSEALTVAYRCIPIAGRHLRALGDVLGNLSGRHIRLLGRFPGLEEDYGPERVLSEQELAQMGRALGIEVVV